MDNEKQQSSDNSGNNVEKLDIQVKDTENVTKHMTKNDSSDSEEELFKIVEIGEHELANIKKIPKLKFIKDRYIKGEIIGEGMFAKVRELIDKTNLERFAVKIIKKSKIDRMPSNVTKNINKEIKLIKKLNHKNVMKMFAFYSLFSRQKYYIILEYCSGVLTEILNSVENNKLPVHQSHHYFCQLIDGIQYLHRNGVFHRDIKSDNLLLNNEHVIKIGDFGVCFILNSFESEDSIYGFEGSKLYQPPELLRDPIEGQTESYSGSKFDIWSSGVVLYNMITGIFPFFSNDEDIWSIDSYNNPKFPDEITSDKTLLNLFHRIFVIDFRNRISTDEIKSHPWFQRHHRNGEKFIELPKRENGDIYRSTNLLERIRYHYYERDPNVKEPVFVNAEDYEESVKRKDPPIRANRLKTSRSPNRGKRSPSRKLMRLGLYKNNEPID